LKSHRAYSSRLTHQRNKQERSNLELPGFRKVKGVQIQNGRAKSARTRDEIVACLAKWEVVHEAKRILNLFTGKISEDAMAAHMEKMKEVKQQEQ